MNILLTGGCGFIGSNLVKFLLQDSKIKHIYIVDNMSKSDTSYLKTFTRFKYFNRPSALKKTKDRVTVVKASVENIKFSKVITKYVDCVIHLAAESGVDTSIKNPFESFKTNVLGGLVYLEASRVNGVRKFIFASSGSVFGSALPPMRETMSKDPISPYGSSKLSIESYCKTFSEVFGIRSTILRFSNAYGPFSLHKKSIIATFTKNILDKNKLIVNGSLDITRDYIYVDDICDSIHRSIFHSKKYTELHVGTGKETSIRTLLNIFRDICSQKNIEFPKVSVEKKRIGDMKKNYTSINKIKKELKWKPKISLFDGISRTISEFQKK
tara:strand:- start:1584 stop:2561 length:978 start_codon:yes stop_codon:yes gene_type:complete